MRKYAVILRNSKSVFMWHVAVINERRYSNKKKQQKYRTQENSRRKVPDFGCSSQHCVIYYINHSKTVLLAVSVEYCVLFVICVQSFQFLLENH